MIPTRTYRLSFEFTVMNEVLADTAVKEIKEAALSGAGRLEEEGLVRSVKVRCDQLVLEE